MGDLPEPRTTPSRPFLKTGMDYGGPFKIKRYDGKTRRTPAVFDKAYFCVFVCFATKAIHLELVSNLTTEAFTAALKRFIGRRGRPSDLYSDCGTNFVGAGNEMIEFMKFIKTLQDSNINSTLANDGINFHFIPPGAPHFGGLWEAGVKSVKFHLKRIIGTNNLNFEEMTTLLAQVEACLNSRPLTAASTDPNDFQVLTPRHFLIGDAITAIPEQNLTQKKEGHLTRWLRVQQLVQHFWRRWSSEYLSRLQNRPKWCRRQENFKVGDVVLIKEDNLPPMKWNMERIQEVHPGNDGLVRTATIKTATGSLKRPIVKLSVLPFDKE